MLWALVAILFVLWVLGLGLNFSGGLITYLLLISLAALLLKHLRRNRLAP
ncbi:MAG TPA: DUF5670 family protein [Terriglobales bacterium]|nr:DUF5670 family protein [Terriglobales bacterium]